MTIADISAEWIARTAGETGLSGVVSLSPLGAGPSRDLAFGFADRANRIPINAETRFATGSLCKGFTGTAIGLLIEDGKVALDTRLADCVRSHPFHFGNEVTIGQLLNHTSGVPDYCSEELGIDYASLWKERPCYGMTTVRDFLPMFENDPLKIRPGAEFLYSNSGFVLLGLVIEELTGRDFRDFIAERIFKPCGMTRSGYFRMDALPENTAIGYLSGDPGDLSTNIYSVPVIGGADGGAFTTVGDMRRFWTALLAGRILNRETLDRFLAPSVPVTERGGTWHYGRGFWMWQARGSWVVSLEGADPGASMESHVWQADNLIMTVASNTQAGAYALGKVMAEEINAG